MIDYHACLFIGINPKHEKKNLDYHNHNVEGCYNTTGTNIATGYRDNKKDYRTNKYASGGSLPRALVMILHKIIETNEWALLNGEFIYV